MGLLFSTYVTNAGAAGPKTAFQIVAPSNRRVTLLGIEIVPQGTTGPSSPLWWDLVWQTTAGGPAGSATLVNFDLESLDDIATVVNTGYGAEPTYGAKAIPLIGLHQQSTRDWRQGAFPRPLIIPGGKRLGLIYRHGDSIPVKYGIFLGE